MENVNTIDDRRSKIFRNRVFDKWQSKTLFLRIFDPRLSIERLFLITAYPVWDEELLLSSVLFDLILCVPVNNFSVMLGWVFQCWSST